MSAQRRDRRWSDRLARAAALTLAAALAAPAGAHAGGAGVVTVEGQTFVVFEAAAGEANVVSMSLSPQSTPGNYVYVVSDTNPIAVSAGCELNFGQVTCTTTTLVPMLAFLGDGDDRARNAGGAPAGISGGPGDDTLEGGAGVPDDLQGDAGDDVLSGDALLSSNPTTVVPAADSLDGGEGRDTASYLNHGGGELSLSLDDQANDGRTGEGDNLLAIEVLIGAAGARNTMTGSAGPDKLVGDDGNDVIRGLGGDDELDGASGADLVEGGEGRDIARGGVGDDTVDGGPGSDSLLGDAASTGDVNTGNDLILARDGEIDQIGCGRGADRAVVDAADVLSADAVEACETVERPPVAPPAPPPASGGSPVGKLELPAGSRRPRSGRLSLTLRCAGPGSCAGRLRAQTAGKVRVGTRLRVLVLGSQSYSAAAGARTTVTIRIGSAARALLRRGPLRVRLIATPSSGGTAVRATIFVRR